MLLTAFVLLIAQFSPQGLGVSATTILSSTAFDKGDNDGKKRSPRCPGDDRAGNNHDCRTDDDDKKPDESKKPDDSKKTDDSKKS